MAGQKVPWSLDSTLVWSTDQGAKLGAKLGGLWWRAEEQRPRDSSPTCHRWADFPAVGEQIFPLLVSRFSCCWWADFPAVGEQIFLLLVSRFSRCWWADFSAVGEQIFLLLVSRFQLNRRAVFFKLDLLESEVSVWSIFKHHSFWSLKVVVTTTGS